MWNRNNSYLTILRMKCFEKIKKIMKNPHRSLDIYLIILLYLLVILFIKFFLLLFTFLFTEECRFILNACFLI